jgi:hypothetical protein
MRSIQVPEPKGLSPTVREVLFACPALRLSTSYRNALLLLSSFIYLIALSVGFLVK